MFNTSKYTTWYFNIITNAAARTVDGYCENHHIIPECLGGGNDNTNLAALTAREHFICHLLLVRMHESYKLKFALHMMTLNNPNQQRNFKITARTYEYIKRLNAVASSIRSKGNQKHNVGKKVFHDPITGDRILVKDISTVPVGWVPGYHPESAQRRKGKHKGCIYYFNPTTNQVIHLPTTTSPPDGFIRGNPNALRAASTTFSKRNQFYDPTSGKFVKSDICPEGFVPGSPMLWVTDGEHNMQVNKITQNIPIGWRVGRTASATLTTSLKKSNERPILTPLGEFTHPNRFAEKYKCDTGFMISLDARIPFRESNEILTSALQDVGYDFSKTKRENGFKFKELDQPNDYN